MKAVDEIVRAQGLKRLVFRFGWVIY